MNRIVERFTHLRTENRKGFVVYIVLPAVWR